MNLPIDLAKVCSASFQDEFFELTFPTGVFLSKKGIGGSRLRALYVEQLVVEVVDERIRAPTANHVFDISSLYHLLNIRSTVDHRSCLAV